MAWTLLDENGHTKYVDGRVTLLDDYDPVAVKQRLEARLRLIRGQWFADLNAGVPWRLFLGGQAADLTAIRQFLRPYILATQGVLSLETLDLEQLENRKLRVRFGATCTNGVSIAGTVTP